MKSGVVPVGWVVIVAEPLSIDHAGWRDSAGPGKRDQDRGQKKDRQRHSAKLTHAGMLPAGFIGIPGQCAGV